MGFKEAALPLKERALAELIAQLVGQEFRAALAEHREALVLEAKLNHD